MPLIALLTGILLMVVGTVLLPSPPASPEEVTASQAMPAFFFGGAYIICSLFSYRNPKHGKSGIFVVSFLGISMAGIGFLRATEANSPFVSGSLLLLSLPLFIGSISQWKKSRRFVPED